MSVQVSVGEIVFLLMAMMALFWLYWTSADFLAKCEIPREWETALCWLIGAGGWIALMLVYDALRKRGFLG